MNELIHELASMIIIANKHEAGENVRLELIEKLADLKVQTALTIEKVGVVKEVGEAVERKLERIEKVFGGNCNVK